MTTFEDSTVHWFAALLLAAVQNGNAIYAAYASSQDRMSSGPCFAGVYGAQVSMVILAVALIWLIVLAVKSFKMAKRHDGLKPLSVVAVSSATAVFIGIQTGLRYCSA